MADTGCCAPDGEQLSCARAAQSSAPAGSSSSSDVRTSSGGGNGGGGGPKVTTYFHDATRRFRTAAAPHTHLLMNGGKLTVTDLREFYTICANAILRNERIYVVEQKTPIFNMFFDFDCRFPIEMEPTKDFYVRVSKSVQLCFHELYGDTAPVDHSLIMCIVPDRKVEKEQNECRKVGMHIYIPWLQVDMERAMFIREAVAQKLDNCMPKADQRNKHVKSWNEDIDSSVYRANGLRMPFSRKITKCKGCTGAECPQCGGTKLIDEGRPYIPLLKLRGLSCAPEMYEADGVTRTLSVDDIVCIFEDTSIRSNQQTNSHELNPYLPDWFEGPSAGDGVEEERMLSSRKRRRTMKEALELRAKMTEGVADVESTLPGKEPLSISDQNVIMAWFNKQAAAKDTTAVPPQYKQTKSLGGFSFCNNNNRSMIIVRLDSTFCQNVARHHRSNTVYLVLNMSTRMAHMGCYCRKETTEGRTARNNRGELLKCSQYHSKPFLIPHLELQCIPIPKLSRICAQSSRDQKAK